MANYVTITGLSHYYGQGIFEKEQRITLRKDPENRHDKEAIQAEFSPLGKVGYVANSPHTVIGDCMSAGRMYDKFGDSCEAVVKFILPKGIVCECETEGCEKPFKNLENTEKRRFKKREQHA